MKGGKAMYTEHEIEIILFDKSEARAWLVDDGSDMEVESYNPSYADK